MTKVDIICMGHVLNEIQRKMSNTTKPSFRTTNHGFQMIEFSRNEQNHSI